MSVKRIEQVEFPDEATADPAVPDTVAIDRHIDRADYILLRHTHYVHALDAPYIARTRKAIIIGSESAANIARDYGVPDDQIITVRGGEDFDFGTFSVRVFPSLHSFGPGKRLWIPATAERSPDCRIRFDELHRARSRRLAPRHRPSGFIPDAERDLRLYGAAVAGA